MAETREDHLKDVLREGQTAESHTEYLRRYIVLQYDIEVDGIGGDFGPILCYEIHTNGLHFAKLAEKWGISLSTLGRLICDHCERLEELPIVNHAGGANLERVLEILQVLVADQEVLLQMKDATIERLQDELK